jgi:hypothetical protein
MQNKKRIVIGVAVGLILLGTVGVFGYVYKTKISAVPSTLKQDFSTEPTKEDGSTEKAALAQALPMSELPRHYQDGVVEWNIEPVKRSDISILSKAYRDEFKGEEQYLPEIDVYEVGQVKSGELGGSKVLIVNDITPTPDRSASVYRFLEKDATKELYFLPQYSAGNFFDAYTSPDDKDKKKDTERELFDTNILSSKRVLADFKIPSLEYPEVIQDAEGHLLKKVGNFPVEYAFDYRRVTPEGEFQKSERYGRGLFFQENLYRFAFSNSEYGNFFTTDKKQFNAVYQQFNPGLTDDTEQDGISTEYGFYVKAPDNTFRIYSPILDLGEVPEVTWTRTNQQNQYTYSSVGEAGCGASVLVDVQEDINPNDLMELGKTKSGKTVYGFKDSNSKVLRDYYKQDKDLIEASEAYFEGKKFNKKTTYEDFLAFYPIFFYYDSYGRLVRFLNQEVIPHGECGKPVIYLYPQSREDISVKVSPTAGMTVSDPAYGDGWQVTADPLGNIFNKADGKIYPYLFWEGNSNHVIGAPIATFATKRENLNSFFDEKLKELGLIQKEINDFKEFWIPRMLKENYPYFSVSFRSRADIDAAAPLEVNPKPDTVIRVMMDYEGQTVYKTAPEVQFRPIERNGFTVVEWGGSLR